MQTEVHSTKKKKKLVEYSHKKQEVKIQSKQRFQK